MVILASEPDAMLSANVIYEWPQDCNGDGLVTCDDYAMMHRNGGYECNRPLADTDYWSIYGECKDLVISNGANI